MPKVSIIIPAYNAERYIEDCVMSVLNQTERDIEVIVVDDGSTDSTSAILNRIKKNDKRLIVIRQNNQGQPKARNVGIERSMTNYLMFLDADDTYQPMMVEKMYHSSLNSKADVVVCGYYNIHTYKNRTYVRRANPNINDYNKSDFFLALHYKELFHVVWNKIYRKDLFDKVRFRNLIPGQDAVLNLEIARKGGVFYYIDDCLYNYYSRAGESIINTYRPSITESSNLIYENWLALLSNSNATRYDTIDFLQKMSFERYHVTLKNLYKNKSPYGFCGRNEYIRENLLKDAQTEIVIQSANFKENFRQKLFSTLYKSHNATLINIVYTVLGKLYYTLQHIMP